MREVLLGGYIFIKYAVTEVAKQNSKTFVKNMTQVEADALKILSKTIEMVEGSITKEMRQRAVNTRKREHCEGDSVITYAVAEVAKENSKKAAKKMTEAEADALKILSKATETAEETMVIQNIERALKTREGDLGGYIVITYAVAEVAKINSKKFVKNMIEAEEDALNILSKEIEKVKDPMEIEMREGSPKTRNRYH